MTPATPRDADAAPAAGFPGAADAPGAPGTADSDWYRLLFERSPAPMWVFDRETLRFLAVNAAAERAYGYAAHEFLDLRITDIRPVDDVPLLLAALATRGSRGTGPAGPTTFRHRTRDGTVRHVSVSSADIDFGGRAARLVLALDATEVEQARAELARRESQLAEAQRVAQMGSWEWDLGDGGMRCSAEMLRLLGLAAPRGALTQDEFMARVHRDDRERVRTALEAARADGHPIDLQYRITRADRAVRRLQARGERVDTGDADAARVIGTAQDVTEREAVDERLRLVHKAEAVGRLAAGIAHDFNNVLTTIRCGADLVADTLAPDDDRRQDIEDIARATDRAASLTRQLLAFARQQVLEPRVLDLNALVRELSTTLGGTLPEDIEQVLALDPALGHVRADRDQLQEVLHGLVMNSRDAMADGGVLMIQTSNTTLDERFMADRPGILFSPGPYVLLSVSDTGEGMDAETRERIFDPFFTTKARGQGSGLGLATVYGIVKQSGGFIWVTSERGRGTRFSIYLPRVDAATEPAPTPRATRTAGVPGGGAETVLVVEDEPLILELASRVLRADGYTVVATAHSEQAAALAAGHDGPVHLLLTDVMMPRLGGPALAEQMVAARPALKVLFMSGYSEGDIVAHRVLQRGVQLLEKPFTPRQLLDRVRAVLDGRG